MKAFNLRMDDSEHALLVAAAARSKCSMTTYISAAISEATDPEKDYVVVFGKLVSLSALAGKTWREARDAVSKSENK